MVRSSTGYDRTPTSDLRRRGRPVSHPFLVPQLDRVQRTGFNPNHINVIDIDNRSSTSAPWRATPARVRSIPADVKVLQPDPVGAAHRLPVEHQRRQPDPHRRPARPTEAAGLAEPAVRRPEPTRVAEGRELYRQHCSSCHTPLDRNDLRTPVKTVLTTCRRAARSRRSVPTCGPPATASPS